MNKALKAIIQRTKLKKIFLKNRSEESNLNYRKQQNVKLLREELL